MKQEIFSSISMAAGVVFAALAIILGLSFIFSLPIMLLWNGCLVPAVTGLSEISWLQGWGISILSALLFKSSASTK